MSDKSKRRAWTVSKTISLACLVIVCAGAIYLIAQWWGWFIAICLLVTSIVAGAIVELSNTRDDVENGRLG